MSNKKCRYPNCHRPALYFMTWTDGTGKQAGRVCGTHDRILGRQNLVRLAGMTVEQAVRWDSYWQATRNQSQPEDWDSWLAKREKPDDTEKV